MAIYIPETSPASFTPAGGTTAPIWDPYPMYVRDEEIANLVVSGSASSSAPIERFGGLGNGVFDNSAAFEAAFQVVDIVTLGNGVYGVSRPIRPYKDRQGIIGQGAIKWPYNSSAAPAEVNQYGPTTIIPLSGFTGDSVIYATESTGNSGRPMNNFMLRDVGIGGLSRLNSTSAAIHGIRLEGAVTAWKVHNVTISQMSGRGVYCHTGAGTAAPRGGDWANVTVWSAGRSADTSMDGFYFSGWSDGTVTNCLAVSNQGAGFYLLNVGQMAFNQCLSVFNLNEGFRITGTTTNLVVGSGNPGFSLVNCYSDRNGKDGVNIDLTGPRAQVTIVGGDYHRDGANAETGGGGYAGIALRGTSSVPVCRVSLVGVRISVEDNDSNNQVWAPQVGLLADYYESLTLDGCYIWGDTTSAALTNPIVPDSLRTTSTTSYFTGHPTNKVADYPDLKTGDERTAALYVGSAGWTLDPAGADTELFSGVTRRLYYDLRTMSRVRISKAQSSSAVANSVAVLQYTTDLTGAGGWTDLSPSVALTANVYTSSAWGLVPSAARTDVLIRVVGRGATGATSPNIQSVYMHVRP